MNWSKSKPDAPGIWYWCYGKEDKVFKYVVLNSIFLKRLYDDGAIGPKERVDDCKFGYWCRSVEPKAYIEHKPPKIRYEVWTANHVQSNQKLWLHVYENGYVAFDSDGKQQAIGLKQNLEGSFYDLEKVESR